MKPEAWGRWGADDEVGAPNLIGPTEVLAGLALARRGKVFNLAQPISSRMPMPPQRAGVSHFMNRDGGDYAAGRHSPGGFQFAEDTLVLPLHTGTHIDGLCHCWTNDQLYNGHSGDTIRSGGAGRCGIETMPPLVTRGVLLDFVAFDGAPLSDGASIGAAQLAATLVATGVTLRSGDVVLLRTGWQERQAAGAPVDYNTEPGLDEEAALFLARADIAAVGADNFAVEAMPFPPGQIFPVHQRLIRDFGIPLIEGLVLQPLAAAGASEFLFVAAPLPVVGGTGSPLTPLAVV